MPLNFDDFEERAAIMQFDGGMTRFAAETAAAQAQGVARWQMLAAIREAENAERGGNSESGGDWPSAVAGDRGADDVPAMQRGAEEKNRSVFEREPQAGRDRLALLAL